MPTVTELRKAGQLDEALAQGLAELATKPADVWAKRNLAWVYHDQLKHLASEDSFGFLHALAAIAKLELGAAEEMLYPNVIWQIVKRLYAMAKASYSIAGWVKVRVDAEDTWARSILPSSDSRARHQTEAHQLLAQMARLPYVIPSEPHSALLKATLHLKEKACPLKLLMAMPLVDALRPEDYQGEEYQGKKQMPLAEQAYMALARELLAEASQHQANITTFLPQLDAAIAQYPGYQWLPFFKAKLQLSAGDAAAALPTLLPVVRQKSGDFWAWNLLAETLEPTDSPAALACLYRASTCGSEEKFLGKLRLKLARLLANTQPGEARWQLERAKATYAAEGWPLKSDTLLLALQLAEHPAAPAEAARREWLALAEQTTYGDLPWQPVVLQEFIEATADKPARARLLPADRVVRPLTVKTKRYPWLRKSALGAPLQVRCETVNGFVQVVQLAPRLEGQLWDVRSAPRLESVPAATREFNGILRVQAAGFGFVDGVFVPVHIINKNGWQTGQRLCGTAVSQFDQKKNKDGWVVKQAGLVIGD